MSDGIREIPAPAWQPIETAPKDGTIILISREGGFVEAAYWNLARRVAGTDKDFPWTTLDEFNLTNGRTEDSPTHWQPLPEAPASR